MKARAVPGPRGALFMLGAVAALLAAAQAAAEPRRDLPAAVERVLAAHEMPSGDFSAFVQRIDASEPVLAFNIDVPRNPASVIKLLTTFIALEDLGPSYRWKTEAYLGGPLVDGVLDGDLYLKGYGDPYLVVERFWLFLRELRQRGIGTIVGDLVIDNTYFDVPRIDPGAFDGQAYRTYNVGPDALLVNFQAVNFTFSPDLEANRVTIIADPLPANLDIRNQLEIGTARCGGFQNGIVIDVTNDAPPDRVTFTGRVGRACGEYRLSRALLDAPSYTYGVFRSLWEESGSKLRGTMRVAPVPEGIGVFHRTDSVPLAEVIRLVNKWSNNVMARHLLLTVGAERFGPPATVDKGREAARMFLAERGLDFRELRIDNGAGLSRESLMTARDLGRLLLAANDSLYRAEFTASLALAGMDGTMRRRFRRDELAGRMHLKTGRLDDVFSTAGYVRSRSGHDYVVVALHNSAGAHRGPGEEAQSALLRWVYAQ